MWHVFGRDDQLSNVHRIHFFSEIISTEIENGWCTRTVNVLIRFAYAKRKKSTQQKACTTKRKRQTRIWLFVANERRRPWKTIYSHSSSTFEIKARNKNKRWANGTDTDTGTSNCHKKCQNTLYMSVCVCCCFFLHSSHEALKLRPCLLLHNILC